MRNKALSIDQIPIGKFSVITRLTQKALRYYDQKGLLVPEAKDAFTGYRYYTGDQIQLGYKIKHLVELGLTVNQIKEYIEAEKKGDQETTEEIIQNRLREAEKELADIQRIVSLLRTPMEVIEKTMSKPTIKETAAQRILSKRELGTYEKTIGKLIMDLMDVVLSPENRNNYVKIAGPFMTLYHDEGHQEEADIEVAVPITGRIMINDPNVEVRNIKPMKVASLIHKGPYETIGPEYGKLLAYVSQEALETTGPMIDVYLNDPNSVPAEEIMTEIRIPVK
jgi:effector-binding domain-containing protein